MNNMEASGNKYESGVLSEILKTPVFKEMIKEYLKGIDPEKGHARAKTLLAGDPEFTLNFVAALPGMINWTAAALEEVTTQFKNYPPQLLYSFLKGVFEGIDKDSLKNAIGSYVSMISETIDSNPEFAEDIQNTIKGPVAETVGKGIDSSLKFINRALEENPRFLSDIVSSVISNIDNKEFRKVSLSITNAVLDTKIPFIKIIFNMLTSRVKHKFKRRKSPAPQPPGGGL